MTVYKRIEDEEVFKVLDRLKNFDVEVDENFSKDYDIANISLLLDIRHFLRKIYKELPKKASNLVTDPTKAKKNDIVIGKENL